MQQYSILKLCVICHLTGYPAEIPEGETEINIDLEVNSYSDSNLKSENELLVQIIGDHESDSEKIDKVAESFEAEKDWFKQQLSDLGRAQLKMFE